MFTDDPAGKTGLVAQRAHVTHAEAALGDGLGDGSGDVGLAVQVQQSDESLQLAVEANAPARHFVQIHAGLGTYGAQPLTPRRSASRPS